MNQKRILTVCEILTQQSKENPNSARDTNATMNQKRILTVRDTNATMNQKRILTMREILTQQSSKTGS